MCNPAPPACVDDTGKSLSCHRCSCLLKSAAGSAGEPCKTFWVGVAYVPPIVLKDAEWCAIDVNPLSSSPFPRSPRGLCALSESPNEHGIHQVSRRREVCLVALKLVLLARLLSLTVSSVVVADFNVPASAVVVVRPLCKGVRQGWEWVCVSGNC